MSQLTVELDELRGLNRAAVVLANLIQNQVIDAYFQPGSFGTPALANAVDSFIDEWSDARRRIGANLDALAEMLSAASQAYAEVESSITGAAGGSGVQSGANR